MKALTNSTKQSKKDLFEPEPLAPDMMVEANLLDVTGEPRKVRILFRNSDGWETLGYRIDPEAYFFFERPGFSVNQNHREQPGYKSHERVAGMVGGMLGRDRYITAYHIAVYRLNPDGTINRRFFCTPVYLKKGNGWETDHSLMEEDFKKLLEKMAEQCHA